MTQPPTSPGDGPTPGGTAAAPAPQWTAPPAPSWTQPWQPPAAPAAPASPRPAVGPARAGSRTALVLAAVLGVLAGVVGGGFLVAMLFVGSAEDIGREIGSAMAPAVRDGITEGIGEAVEQSMGDAMAFAEEGLGVEGREGATGPVEEYPPVEPEDLGPDPVLDAYAQDCFAGDLQACDDLYYEAPPMSEYESYGVTCGGRVKECAVMACTELG